MISHKIITMNIEFIILSLIGLTAYSFFIGRKTERYYLEDSIRDYLINEEIDENLLITGEKSIGKSCLLDQFQKFQVFQDNQDQHTKYLKLLV